MMMYKRIFLACLLMANVAAAQEVAITGKDFLSGAGDAKLAQMGRDAAAQGKVVVITAPKYWLNQAAAKVRSGTAGAHVSTSEGFFENVVVRIEDPKPAKPVEAPKPKAEAAPKAEAPVAKPEPKPKAPPAPEPVVVAPPPPAPEPVKAAPVVAPTPVAAAPAAKAPPVDPSIAIKQRFEQNLNSGKPADGEIQVSQLERDDQLFVDGNVRAVVRRLGAHTQLFWLQGELNLERTELTPNGANRYRVAEPVLNVTNPSLRGDARSNSQHFVGSVPAANSPVRAALQKQYSEGKDVEESIGANDLRQGDTIYTGNGAAIVVRRAASGYARFWLTGEIDLHQTGLKQQGNLYRVLTDTIK
jgi:outer membrane biosynthesis protein TonB